MGHTRESYPDQIRRIAEDLDQVRHLWELDHAAKNLRAIAEEIERLLKAIPDKPEPKSIHGNIIP